MLDGVSNENVVENRTAVHSPELETHGANVIVDIDLIHILRIIELLWVPFSLVSGIINFLDFPLAFILWVVDHRCFPCAVFVFVPFFWLSCSWVANALVVDP